MKITDYKSFDDMPMFISIPQTAELLGVSETFLYGYIRKNKSFPVMKLGRRRVIPTEKLKQWIDNLC